MLDYIISNEGVAQDEAVLGDFSVFADVGAAELEWEPWVSEEPGIHFYDARGERLIAIDRGDRGFHLEKTGTVFAGFEDLVRRGAERAGIAEPAGFALEKLLRALCDREQTFQREHKRFLRWFSPPRRFREKYGFWKWYLPFHRLSKTGSGQGIRRHRPWEIHVDDRSFWDRFLLGG